MATIPSFCNYHSPHSNHPSPLLLRYSLISTLYLRPVSSGDRWRRVHFSVLAAGNRKVEKDLSDDRLNGTLASGRRRAVGIGKKVEKSLANEDGWKWPLWKELPMRYKLIGMTSLAFVVCNMDKVNLSVAIIPMSHQFGWSSSTSGLVQSSFFWGYALSQLPGGWLATLFGGRKVLEIGVLSWSLSTMLVPNSAGFIPGLVLSRILVGIGEGVSPSAATDLIARSIPLQERSRAVAFVFGGLSAGSILGGRGRLSVPTILPICRYCCHFSMAGSLHLCKHFRTL